MEDLLKTLAISREETILKHYNAAVAELNDKVVVEPLRTNFRISSGCVTKEITEEISHRLNSNGIKTSVGNPGFMGSYHLLVEVALPPVLIHKEGTTRDQI